MNDHKNQLELLQKYLDSDEGKKDMEVFAKKIKNRDNKRLKDKARYDAMTDAEFKSHVIAEDAKHDEAYIDSCYKAGHEPNPKKEMQNIIDVMLHHGKEYTPRNWEMFAAVYSKYKGLTITLYQGQGSFTVIKSGKKVLSHI